MLKYHYYLESNFVESLKMFLKFNKNCRCSCSYDDVEVYRVNVTLGDGSKQVKDFFERELVSPYVNTLPVDIRHFDVTRVSEKVYVLEVDD